MWNEFFMEWSLQNFVLRHIPITCRKGKLWSESAKPKTDYPLKLPIKDRGIAPGRRTWKPCRISSRIGMVQVPEQATPPRLRRRSSWRGRTYFTTTRSPTCMRMALLLCLIVFVLQVFSQSYEPFGSAQYCLL